MKIKRPTKCWNHLVGHGHNSKAGNLKTMTNDNSTPNGPHVQLGGLSYELVIAVSAVHAGVEMLGRRPDIPAAMKPPLQILENLASEAVEASISLQSSL